MKKNILVLAGASMLVFGAPLLMTAPVQAASGPFADVPADHWAYQSVDTLQKAGIVIGYPDGTYGGKRAMTRYEFAVAIARLLPLLNQPTGNYATKDDLAALRADLESKLSANQAAIDALRKLVDEFQPELEKLGQDVAAVKERLDSLEARVAAVEEEQRRIRFDGALNIIARGDVLTNRDANGNLLRFIDKNGVVSDADSKHILQTSDVWQDFVLGIRGKLSDTATANVKLDFGNFLSAIGDTAQAGNGPSPGATTAANQQTTVWEAYLSAPVSLGPLGGAELVAGRFGNQWTKWTLKQVDADVYTQLYQTDSGNLPMDGAKVNLKLGPAGIQAFAGKESAIPFVVPFGGAQATDNGQFRPFGQIAEDQAAMLTQGAGVRATFGKSDRAVLGLSVSQWGLAAGNFSQFSAAKPNLEVFPNGSVPVDPERGLQYDRLSVYGADFNGLVPFFTKSGLTVDAAWTASGEGQGNGFNNVANNWRYQSTEDQLGIVLGNLTLKGGYEYVGPHFSAPGYWGKVGAWTNPTNIEGAIGSAKYAFGPKLTLNADIESYKTAYSDVFDSPLQKGDHLNRYQVGLGYGLSSSYAVDLGYESVTWDLKDDSTGLSTLKNPGKPTETYTTFGIGHTFNPNASFKFLYQIVDYKDKNTGFLGTDAKGGVAVGQFSLKF
jgi:uncharacterized coiled-coil protein SlyX